MEEIKDGEFKTGHKDDNAEKIKHRYILIGSRKRKNKATVIICGKEVHFNPKEEYTIEEIASYLKKIHTGIFTEQAVKLPIASYGASGKSISFN